MSRKRLREWLDGLWPAVFISVPQYAIVFESRFKWHTCTSFRNRGSSVSIVSDYGLDDWAIGVRSPAEAKDFPLTSVSRPALRPAQPPVQWVPGILSPGVKRGRGVTLTTHHHLVPRSRMSRSYISSPPSATMACSGTALLCTSFTPNDLKSFSHTTLHSLIYAPEKQTSLTRCPRTVEKIHRSLICIKKHFTLNCIPINLARFNH
jgi:hypothetical protein